MIESIIELAVHINITENMYDQFVSLSDDVLYVHFCLQILTWLECTWMMPRNQSCRYKLRGSNVKWMTDTNAFEF